MPAKPQQMSDSQEKSDDLIAELAKLMASSAQGSESEPKPTVIKLAPLSEATVPSPSPIRIPGMEAPAAAAASAAPSPAPTIRIPGMERPAAVPTPAPSQEAHPEPRPQPSTPIDFGKPPTASPVVVPEPMSGWQTREVPKPAPQVSVPPPAQAPVQPAAAHVEPASAPSPSPATPQAPVQARPAAAGGDFNFDFGFGSEGQSSGERAASPAPAAAHEESPKAAPAPGYDPIADLIAAELDAAQAEPAAPEPPKADVPPAASVFPASVEAVPARNFGNTTAGQAPVLIARPVGSSAPQAAPSVAFRPLPQTPKPAESDKFAVAPVFGLGGRPTPAPASQPAPAVAATPVAPRAPLATSEIRPSPSMPAAGDHSRHEPDPMDEIESLIGEAVRVELSSADKPAAAPQAPARAPAAPVVPPLTTGFAPRRAGLKDSEPQMRSAEAAILAAAAATGAEVGRIESETQEDRPYKRGKIKPHKAAMFGGVRQYVGMAVAGTLLLAAGFGLYWVLGMGRGDGTAPVLTADATPAKQAPAPAAADTAEPARSVVFDEIDGVAAADNAETLVSRDETAGASVAEVARVVTPDETTTETGLANRKVRTVTVRPDGTIVSGDEAVAGTEVLPVERPNVPAVPGASVEPSDLLTAAVASDEATAAAGAVQPAGADPIATVIAEGGGTEAAPLAVSALAPTGTTPAVFDASIVAPTPMPRPADRSALNAGGGSAQPTSLDDLPLVDLNEPVAEPAVAAQPAVDTSGGTAAAYVQISSQTTEADAQASIRAAQARWGSLFGGNQLIIQRADLGQKGIRYRVRLPASSLQEATQICASIKADGGDCFATNG